MLSPKRVIHRKVQRGKVKGNATRANNIDFGQIALVALEPVWLQARHIEAARVAINRKLERKGNVWLRVFPDKPITKKPSEVRMGKGKGSPEFWAANIKPGVILFEVGGIDIKLAEQALKLAADKLPIRTKIAYKPTID
ncbi:MAG: 50S ribosomal protein L16 [Spirochaetales bacterium]|jgi:large subunit ribosomal protein L16|uniref:Large ribosomal subunit protein uL16 n=1 Tax=Treponema berlinense TaxID=225004 RepID=A0A1T4PHA5_9SPIR|nr:MULTISPECIES: 50S ribosomal protein L16 [Treponema]MDO5766133.1 50S ribosomal protein L16 [Spirochaetales bacterium]MBQ9101935.1 50S ribosomal protein L16 [Treponema sp.]MCI5540952.1 50S ribosomal protein L16 [Treponema berlinense]MDY3708142.1 50S ribosomal protein L16 [Treponema berlinense]SJZ90801.1 large subunit ribosomal protein L16 [Treponema berlinense]